MHAPRSSAGATTRGRNRGAETEGDQDAGRIGRELNARAGLLQPLRLLEHDDAQPALGERQRRRQPANPAPAMMTVREDSH